MGVPEGLPEELHVGRFLDARIKEISGFTKALAKDVKHGKLASQQVPNHMRRRAISHDPRRLPRRLRGKHKRERESGQADVPPSKRPSRKHRRRPSNLLAEYNRRQRSVAWLETHIWHAKRFHMGTRWGFKIPLFPNDKSWRACYRAAESRCLMFDISYHHLLQITCKDNVYLVDRLNMLTDQRTGKIFYLPVDDKIRDGESLAVVYEPANEGHRRCVGELSYLWIPEPGSSSSSQLWLWIHPSFADKITSLLESVLELVSAGNTESTPISDSTPAAKINTETTSQTAEDLNEDGPKPKRLKRDKDPDGVHAAKLAVRNIPSLTRAPRLLNTGRGIELFKLTGTVNRFRLVGPQGAALLQAVCQPASVVASPDGIAVSAGSPQQRFWWTRYYAEDTARAEAAQNAQQLSQLSAQSSWFGCTVRDPRLLLPVRKSLGKVTKPPVRNLMKEVSPRTRSCAAGFLPFFSAEIRDAVCLSKSADSELNRQRSQLLVSGSPLNLGSQESRIPILIVPHTSGYDLCTPAGWAMAFWMCLVHHGARVGGWREINQFSLEKGCHPLLERYPESPAGEADSQASAEQLQARYWALPPKKRPNYTRLSVAAPFRPSWAHLLADWHPLPESGSGPPHPPAVLRRETDLTSVWEICRAPEERWLVPVRIRIQGRGTLCENTMLCLPLPADLQALEEDSNYGGPEEPLASDPMEGKRKQERNTHQARKKQLKRQWKKIKDKQVLLKTQSTALGRPLDVERLSSLTSSLQTLKTIRQTENSRYNLASRGLWLRDDSRAGVRQSASRQIIGFVTAAQFAYHVGGFVGVGYVALGGLGQLAADERRLILVREPTSLQYRFARLEIVTV